ncbi:MAG: hypothetical protein HQ593_06740 [Candidatus Omnitrophica bacterium]|nr:hypothetical protein [Candidatus Omnitrophota bacterium]
MTKKDKIELIVTSVGVLALIFVIGNIFKAKGQTKAGRKVAAKTSSAAAGTMKGSTSPNINFQKFEDKMAVSEWGKDPFTYRPLAHMGDLKLGGIVWDEEAPTAIIDGEIVGVGDEIEGNIVVEIQPDKVILNDGTKIVELTLGL